MNLSLAIVKKGGFFQGDSQEKIISAVTKAMYEATFLLEGKVKELTPQGVYGDRGAGLRSTIYGKPINPGTPVVQGIVAHGSPYGDVIELGRRPGQKFPPPGVLIDWIVHILKVSEEKAKEIELPIRRKIAFRGFEGKFMFSQAFYNNLGTIKKIFNEAGFQIVKKMS